MKRGAPCSELPIAGGYQGGAILLKVRIASGVLGEECFDIRVALYIERFLGTPGDFFQAAKEENLDADGWRNARHVTIVTPRSRKQPAALVTRSGRFNVGGIMNILMTG